MTDRELLELAAKAEGHAVEFDDLSGLTFWGDKFTGLLWDPLHNDGDALRLAVKLSMTLLFDTLPDGSVVKVSIPWDDNLDKDFYLIEWLHKDADAATRRAIVRAAAEIGKGSGG